MVALLGLPDLVIVYWENKSGRFCALPRPGLNLAGQRSPSQWHKGRLL